MHGRGAVSTEYLENRIHHLNTVARESDKEIIRLKQELSAREESKDDVAIQIIDLMFTKEELGALMWCVTWMLSYTSGEGADTDNLKSVNKKLNKWKRSYERN
jgi:DNA-directed RNA polymerase subunit F